MSVMTDHDCGIKSEEEDDPVPDSLEGTIMQ